MNNVQIREELFKHQDLAYLKFQTRICPSASNMIGVRLPILRNIAKNICKNNVKEYLEHASSDYYEEVMLQGLVIGYLKNDINTVLSYLDKFIPKINDWSICDSTCSTLKITIIHKQVVWRYLNNLLNSNQEYTLRFVIVMFLNYYMTDEYIYDILKILDNIKHDGYYVKMAIAWTISIAYVKFPNIVFDYLNNNTLDKWTYNKTIQKITESLQIDSETKKMLKSMKK